MDELMDDRSSDDSFIRSSNSVDSTKVPPGRARLAVPNSSTKDCSNSASSARRRSSSAASSPPLPAVAGASISSTGPASTGFCTDSAADDPFALAGAAKELLEDEEEEESEETSRIPSAPTIVVC